MIWIPPTHHAQTIITTGKRFTEIIHQLSNTGVVCQLTREDGLWIGWIKTGMAHGKAIDLFALDAAFWQASLVSKSHHPNDIASPTSPPVALTIAGSDSSAGAGIQADLKTFAAHGVYGVNAITAIVAEAPGSVSQIQPTDPSLLTAQLGHVSTSFPISAIKTGMLATGENVVAVARFIEANPAIPVVVDPVMRATAGEALLDESGRDRLGEDLIPLATLITPNLPEVAALLEKCEDSIMPAEAALQLFETFGSSFLVKGGHTTGENTIVDYACIGGNVIELPHERLAVADIHGTGCALSSSIASRLALGQPLLEAISGAVSYLTSALAAHFSWPQSGGSEALNHLPNSVD